MAGAKDAFGFGLGLCFWQFSAVVDTGARLGLPVVGSGGGAANRGGQWTARHHIPPATTAIETHCLSTKLETPAGP